MSEQRLNEELAAVENALNSLMPSADPIDRNRLMFMVARATVQRTEIARRRKRFIAWLQPCVTAASLLLAAGFGILWAVGEKPEAAEKSPVVARQFFYPPMFDSPDELPPTFPPSNLPPSSNWALSRLVMEKGVDAIPFTNVKATRRSLTPSGGLETQREMLKRMLDELRG